MRTLHQNITSIDVRRTRNYGNWWDLTTSIMPWKLPMIAHRPPAFGGCKLWEWMQKACASACPHTAFANKSAELVRTVPELGAYTTCIPCSFEFHFTIAKHSDWRSHILEPPHIYLFFAFPRTDSHGFPTTCMMLSPESYSAVARVCSFGFFFLPSVHARLPERPGSHRSCAFSRRLQLHPPMSVVCLTGLPTTCFSWRHCVSPFSWTDKLTCPLTHLAFAAPQFCTTVVSRSTRFSQVGFFGGSDNRHDAASSWLREAARGMTEAQEMLD